MSLNEIFKDIAHEEPQELHLSAGTLASLQDESEMSSRPGRAPAFKFLITSSLGSALAFSRWQVKYRIILNYEWKLKIQPTNTERDRNLLISTGGSIVVMMTPWLLPLLPWKRVARHFLFLLE